MVGVGGGPAGDFAQVVARDDRVRVRPAHAARRLGGDAARPHVAEAAANAVLAEGALAALGVQPREAGVHAVAAALFSISTDATSETRSSAFRHERYLLCLPFRSYHVSHRISRSVLDCGSHLPLSDNKGRLESGR